MGLDLQERAERYFELRRHGTTFRSEVDAGIAAYLASAYVLLVNGQILSTAGMMKNDAVKMNIFG